MASRCPEYLAASIKFTPINLAVVAPDALALLQVRNVMKGSEYMIRRSLPDDLDLGNLNH